MHEPMTVLLVDDDVSILSSVYRELEEEGYSVLAASNASEALEICRQYRRPIDLLLTDVSMPEMSGIELARQALLVRPLMKMLFMSANRENRAGPFNVALPAWPLLAKPFGRGMLMEKLRAALGPLGAGRPGE